MVNVISFSNVKVPVTQFTQSVSDVRLDKDTYQSSLAKIPVT